MEYHFLGLSKRVLILLLLLSSTIAVGCAPSGSECARGRHPCPQANTVCVEALGNPTCECLPGYSGDPATGCVDVDECAADPNLCAAPLRCLNEPGTYACGPDETECGYSVDPGSVQLHVTHVTVPIDSGFNVDGLNNTAPPAGQGATVAGCGVLDGPQGVDLGFVNAAMATTPILDFPIALQAGLGAGGIDGGVSGTYGIDLELLDLRDASSDAAVVVNLRITAPDGTTTQLATCGAMTNDVVRFTAGGRMTLPLPISSGLASASCVGGSCTAAELDLVVPVPVGRIVLDATHSQLLPGSMLGGYLFLGDADPSYASLDSASVPHAIDAFATAAGMTPGATSALKSAFSGARDLHVSNVPAVDACTGATSNANALAFALGIDGI